MKKLLITTHGNLGDELLKTAEMILGAIEQVTVLGLKVEDSFDYYQKQIVKLINEENISIVLTDIVNASPYNAAVLATRKVESKPIIVAGTNLPLLIEVITAMNGDHVTPERMLEIVLSSKESISVYQEIN